MILITGASGFLGTSIWNFFSTQEVPILSLGKTGLNDINCDLSSETPYINSSEIELVIHAAGKAHVTPKTKIEVNDFFEVNVKGTENLLRSLDQLPTLPKYFVFISSVAVYGLDSGTNIRENTPLLASDPYGSSKIRAEKIVIDWCKQHNVKSTILRLPLLVGKNPPGNLGAMITAIRKGYYFNIDNGEAKKSMVLAEDVARFISMVARLGGTYNLTDGVHPSFSALSNAIAQNRVKNLPLCFAKILGLIGDIFGENAIINSNKVRKITSDLTFDDSTAREMGWSSQSVLEYLNVNYL